MDVLISYYVLSAISNDYEDFDMVVGEVFTWAERDGLRVSREEIVKTLLNVIKKGFAQAYIKHADSRLPSVSDFSAEQAIDPTGFYFFVTAAGKRLVMDLDSLS